MVGFVPIIGIVLEDGHIESYDLETALKHKFHHSFIMSSKEKKSIDYDQALRFVKLEGEDFYTLEGEPSLEPYSTGRKQISAFAAYCIENGVNPNTRLRIKDHKLGTRYEGLVVGCLKDFYKKEDSK